MPPPSSESSSFEPVVILKTACARSVSTSAALRNVFAQELAFCASSSILSAFASEMPLMVSSFFLCVCSSEPMECCDEQMSRWGMGKRGRMKQMEEQRPQTQTHNVLGLQSLHIAHVHAERSETVDRLPQRHLLVVVEIQIGGSGERIALAGHGAAHRRRH